METNRRSPFGVALRQFREASGLSQEQLAERAGLSLRGISDLERGLRTTPRLETVTMLAEGLGLNESQRGELLAARKSGGQVTASQYRMLAGRLPQPPTSFVGRTEEIATIIDQFENQGTRLLTLVGPGGIGKTRIAIEAARRLVGGYAPEVTFVDLSPIRNPDRVITAIANGLGLAEQRGTDIRDLLVVALQDRTMLLVLDNLEQVIEAARDIAWLLEASPELAILATSRARLRVNAEHAISIDPMTLPSPENAGSLPESDAGTLFVSRARAVDHVFAVTPENASEVAEIVTRLQGMPLAIELAAARIRLLSIPELMSRLNSQLPMLTGGARDAPARHRTMRDTIAWSYELLSPRDQAVFRTVAIFRDACSLETAIAVLGVDNRFSEADVLDAIESLVDCSMLRPREGPDGQMRYRMLQTLQEFGLEQLAAMGEETMVHQSAQVAWGVPLVHEAEFAITTPDVVSWLQRMDAESLNLKSQMIWLIEHDEVEAALNVSLGLAAFNSIRGHFDESRQELEMILSHSRLQADSFARMRGLIVLGNLCNHQGDASHSITSLEKGAALAEKLGKKRHRMLALIDLGIAMFMKGDLDAAVSLHNESLVIAREIDDHFGIATCFRLLATLLETRGDFKQSHELLQESLRLSLAGGFIWSAALAKINLGFQSVLLGDLDRAEAFTEGARDLFNQFGSPRELPLVLYTLADIARMRRDFAAAEKLLLEALGLARDLGSLRAVAPIFLRLGRIAMLQGNVERARLFTLEAISWFERSGDVSEVVVCLGLAADLAIQEGDTSRAAWCMGAIDGVSSAHNLQPLQIEAGERKQRFDLVFSCLSQRDWQEQYNRSLTMTDKDILVEAKSWLSCRISDQGRFAPSGQSAQSDYDCSTR